MILSFLSFTCGTALFPDIDLTRRSGQLETESECADASMIAARTLQTTAVVAQNGRDRTFEESDGENSGLLYHHLVRPSLHPEPDVEIGVVDRADPLEGLPGEFVVRREVERCDRLDDI
jgi:hypothetical protein